ncbi:MAG: hypothetical protein WCQ69_08505, partial [Bacteroidales bacterium]
MIVNDPPHPGQATVPITSFVNLSPQNNSDSRADVFDSAVGAFTEFILQKLSFAFVVVEGCVFVLPDGV